MPFMRPVKFQTRLTLVFCAFVFGIVSIFIFLAIRVYESEQKMAFELRADSLASLLAESVTNVFYEAGRLDRMRLLLRNVLQQPHVAYVYAYDQDGRILADGTEENRYFNVVLQDAFHANAVKATGALLQYRQPEFQAPDNILDIAQPVFLAGGRAGQRQSLGNEKLGGVRIAFTLLPVQAKIVQFRRVSLVFGVLLGVVGGILSALVSRRVVKPISDLVTGTRSVTSGNLDVQIHPSSHDELGVLAISFNQMATSLKENASALQRKVIENQTLYEIGQEITAQIALEPTLKLIVERARTLLQAEVSLLALRQEESDVFAMEAYDGSVPEALAKLRFKPGEGLGGRVVSGTPMMVGDYVEELPDSPFRDIVRAAGLRSQVAVPLQAHTTVIGVLYAISRLPHKFRQEDQNLLSALADHAAIAIENAKLYQAVRRHAEEMEAKVNERTRELQEANRQLEAASHHKSAFLANVSHELRTPLNAIIGFTRVIMRKTEGQIPALQQENLRKVLISAEHLLNLINGLLDLSKIEAGRMEVFAEFVKLDEIIHGAATTVAPLLKSDHVRIIEAVDPAIPPLHTDREKVNQIVLNLLSNAAKFTEQGEIKIAAWQDNGAVKIAVSDMGIGIAAEDLRHIFEEFRQADMSSSRKYGGTGLGLAIVKRFVTLLGGDIVVESAVGKGSTFTVTLPLRSHGKDDAGVGGNTNATQKSPGRR